MQTHLAPRHLQVRGITAHGTCVQRSILAGCAQSIPLTRVLLKGDLDIIARSDSSVAIKTFVDDCSQSAVGPTVRVCKAVTCAS
eukprot:12202802-Alexandrium_andersonii.AAC.1